MQHNGNERVTTIGPLTTVFTPLEPCYTALLHCRSATDRQGSIVSACDIAPYGFTCKGTTSEVATQCFPGGVVEQWVSYDPVFSPGLLCPDNWSSAGKIEGYDDGTTTLCCPAGGYQFDGSNCHSVMDLATSKIVMSQCADDWFEEHPVSTYTREVRTITIPMDGGMSSIATMINIVNGSNTIASSKAFWWAYPVKLVQPAASSSMDTLQASASASPSNTLPAPTGAPTTDPVQDNAAGNNETSPQKGLATTTKIAIGVAVPLLALLVAAAAFFFLRRRKRRTAQAGTKPEEEVDSTTDWIGPEMDGSAQINEASGAPRPNPELDGVVRIGEVFGDTVQKPELDSAHINEVSGDTDHVPELGAGTETTPFSGPTELDANKGNLPSSGPHELDGGNHWTSELDANSGRKEMGDRYR